MHKIFIAIFQTGGWVDVETKWSRLFLEGGGFKTKKNKKEVKTFFHLNIYNIVSSYDDIPQHYRCWTITLDMHLSENLWRQCWLCLNFSKNKKKNLYLHILRISVAILSRRYSRSIFQMCYLICICIHG